jgi:chromate transporter
MALLAAAMLGTLPDTSGQILVLLMGAVIGRLALAEDKRQPASPLAPTPRLPPLHVRRAGTVCLAAFFLLLAASFLFPGQGALALFGAFYRAGALVFGGGHVVLPMLRDAVVVPGWVSPQMFLAGYGGAQAMPGPLFTVAAFLGAVANAGPGGISGAVIAIAGIFLPGLLIVAGTLPFWQILKAWPGALAVMQGVNAAVVGLLGAAFINLAALTAVQSLWDLLVAAGALALLTLGRARPILVVLFCAAACAALSGVVGN